MLARSEGAREAAAAVRGFKEQAEEQAGELNILREEVKILREHNESLKQARNTSGGGGSGGGGGGGGGGVVAAGELQQMQMRHQKEMEQQVKLGERCLHHTSLCPSSSTLHALLDLP